MAAESKISFFDSLIKIGQGFQEIFGIFGNAIRDTLGLTAVKSGDKRSKVGEHFEKIKKGLEDTNGKLKELSSEISEAKNADGSTIEAVKGAIKGANDVFEQLVTALTKLAGVAKEAGDTNIGAAGTNGDAGAKGADKDSVETIIKEVKSIIEIATKSGVNIEKGNDSGAEVDNGNGPKVLAGNAKAGAGDAAKLAAEVSKADPWAMIDKIQNAKTKTGVLDANTDKGSGQLATGTGVADVKAATNADLAAAVALKAMTKGGKFTQPNDNEDADISGAAVTAVNKVLGILDFIIRKTVSINLDKIREAVKGIQYSEPTTESTEASTITQPATTK
ncbi:variable large family protein (plasmid) [Borrelia turicatae]|nr:variable large family protein [Borrelia turicatae]